METARPNLIVVIADTFRADHLGCNGNDRVKTPCLDKLAGEGVNFTNCHADGLPTIPERRVFFTGKSIIPKSVHGGWTPLRPDDVSLPMVLEENGYKTGLIADTYHYFRPGMNFHKGFRSWEWIRGQEFDTWRSGPRDAVDPRDHMPEHLWSEGAYDEMMRMYLLNNRDVKSEEDYPCARSFRAGMRWLEDNKDDGPFMLFLDTFDPHEPWDAPQEFQDMYYDDWPCERFLFGYGVHHDAVKPEDYPMLRASYAAEVSFVDMWIGRFMDRLDALGLRDNTIVAFSSDHGTHIGEEGCVQKSPCLLNSCVARLPLIVRHPQSVNGGQTVDALVSSVDFMPTFLDMLGVEDRPEMDGTDFWKLATGEADAIHDRVFSEFGDFAMVRDLKWHYFQHTSGDDPGKGPCLYDLEADPEETTNVAGQHADIATELRGQLGERLDQAMP